GDPALEQRQMAVLRGKPGFHAGDVLRKPDAVAEGDELVLLPLAEQDRDADRREVESPRADECKIVVEPAVASRLDAGAHVLEQLGRELARRDLAVRRTEQGLPELDELLGLRGEQLCTLFLHRRAMRFLALEDDAELLDVLLAHAGEEVEPLDVVRCYGGK